MPVTEQAPVSPGTAHRAVDEASLIVVGKAVVAPGAPTDSVEIKKVLNGAGSYGVTLEAGSGIRDGASGIYYLTPGTQPGRWRSIPPPVPPLDEAAVIEAVANRPAQPPPDALAASFATFRAFHDQPWNEAQQPAIRATVMILDGWALVGNDEATIRTTLGPPDSIEKGAWKYMRHNGDSGAGFQLHFNAGRVTIVDLVRTQ